MDAEHLSWYSHRQQIEIGYVKLSWIFSAAVVISQDFIYVLIRDVIGAMQTNLLQHIYA